MPVKFRLHNVEKKDLYGSQPKAKREEMHPQIIEMAKTKGVKPAARYFNTYPSTVRRILKKYDDSKNK